MLSNLNVHYVLFMMFPVSTLVGGQALRSSSGGKLLVPRVNTSTMQRREKASE